MSTPNPGHRSLSALAARRLACTTKTTPQMGSITPRWLLRLLPWLPVEAGTFRVNRVVHEESVEVVFGQEAETTIRGSFVDYEENPREYGLKPITAVLDLHTRISDLYNKPHDQVREQLRLTVEAVKERQEGELINNPEYGLVHNVEPAMRVQTRGGPPTPDDLDDLIARVWKEPAFFLAHPRAIAAFGRECTVRGVPPSTTMMYGSPFLTWRGIPIVPCDKLPIDGQPRSESPGGRTSILLLRTGEARQGVVGLYQERLTGEQTPGLSVRFMGVDRNAVASYLITLYCSAAVLTPDALGALENVETGFYHGYE